METISKKLLKTYLWLFYNRNMEIKIIKIIKKKRNIMKSFKKVKNRSKSKKAKIDLDILEIPTNKRVKKSETIAKHGHFVGKKWYPED